MVAKSNDHIAAFLDAVFLNVLSAPWSNIGLNPWVLNQEVGPDERDALAMALHSADPGKTGDQTTNELSYTQYLRVDVLRGAGLGWVRNSQTIENTGTITFPENLDPATSTARYWSVGAKGSDEILWSGPLGETARTFVTNRTNNVFIIPRQQEDSYLAAADTVVLHSQPGTTFPVAVAPSTSPTTLTEGDVFAVQSVIGSPGVDEDEIVLEETVENQAFAITGDGGGLITKFVPLVIGQNTTPRLDPGEVKVNEY